MTTPALASLEPFDRGKTWAEVRKIGRIACPDGYRGWHVVVWVEYPGARHARRERITWAEGIGQIRTRAEARSVLDEVRAQLRHHKLHEVIIGYKRADVPENTVLARWNSEMLPKVREKFRQHQIGRDRLLAFEAMERRGYLDFWQHRSIYAVTEGQLELWLSWLRETYPHLKAVSLRHILRDFGTFLRYEKKIETIRGELPKLPAIKVPKPEGKVPNQTSLARILAEIPEERRGLFLGRSRAGLRPAEARRLNVVHFSQGTIVVPGEISKTGESRELLVASVAPDLDAWIRKWRLGAKPWEPLFPNPTALKPEKRWMRTAERETWKRACAKAGVEYVRPNWGGRHAFATHEVKSGTNLLGVQKWMGHKRFQTTQLYIDEFDAVELAEIMRPKTTLPPDKRGRK